MELYFKTREEWRNWLEINHSSCDKIWLIYYKKQSGRARIPYEHAVEEALCYGWIDGKIKRINEDYYIQLFTPRRRKSRWSKLNMERANKLIKAKLMQPAGLKAFQEAIDHPELTYENRTDVVPTVPEDLINAFNKNQKALDNFHSFSPSIRRLYLLWLDNAKRAETRKIRIEKIVSNSENNIKAGII